MEPNLLFTIISAVISLVCCGGGCLFIFLMILGFVLLRRRGKKNVTPQEAVQAGVASVSQVFVRGEGGLQEYDDDDDD